MSIGKGISHFGPFPRGNPFLPALSKRYEVVLISLATSPRELKAVKGPTISNSVEDELSDSNTQTGLTCLIALH